MEQNLSKGNSTANMLLDHLITSPNLPDQLGILHSLALYDSGDALLGPEEKEALLNTARMEWLLRRMPRSYYRLLRRQLRQLE